jgi:hypothetical protein
MTEPQQNDPAAAAHLQAEAEVDALLAEGEGGHRAR